MTLSNVERARRGVTASGSVFAIHLGAGLLAIGQVVWVGPGGGIIAVVFSGSFPSGQVPPIEGLVELPVVLEANTTDGFLTNGRWEALGAAPIVYREFERHRYKVMTAPPGQWAVTDFSGRIVRQARPFEAGRLPNHRSFSPIAIEQAAQALAGVRPSEKWHEKLAPRDESAGSMSSVRVWMADWIRTKFT